MISFVVETILGKTRERGPSGAARQKHGSSFCQAAAILAAAARRFWSFDGGGRGAQSYRMSRPRDQFEITTDILLRAYSIGLFPMAESATDEKSVLGGPGGARHLPARRSDRLEKPRQDGSLRSFRGSKSIAISMQSSMPAPPPMKAARRHGSMGGLENSNRQLFDIGRVHTVESWLAASSPAGSMASTSARHFSAKACFTARPTPRKSLSCISLRGWRRAGSACSTRNS